MVLAPQPSCLFPIFPKLPVTKQQPRPSSSSCPQSLRCPVEVSAVAAAEQGKLLGFPASTFPSRSAQFWSCQATDWGGRWRYWVDGLGMTILPPITCRPAFLEPSR